MSRSLTLFLTCISLIALSLEPNRISAQERSGAWVVIADTPVNDSVPGRTIYRASVDFHGQSLSLLLILKKLPDGQCRAALVNELGLGFMNASIRMNGKRAEFIIGQVHPILDKRNMIRRLRKGILIKAKQCCFQEYTGS